MKETARFNAVIKKVVEVAPSVSLPDNLREQICEAAVDLMRQIQYVNAGTVEFFSFWQRILLY